MKIILFFLLLVQTAKALEKFEFTIFYGEKRTQYQWDEPQEVLKKTISARNLTEIKLAKENQHFIEEKFIEILKMETNDSKLCSERFIKVKFKDQTKVGCIGSVTPVAKKLTELANLFDFL
jgi:hypothetical protein